MNNDLENDISNTADEPVVIPDECGDSLWDTVLEQPAFVAALIQATKQNPKAKNINSFN